MPRHAAQKGYSNHKIAIFLCVPHKETDISEFLGSQTTTKCKSIFLKLETPQMANTQWMDVLNSEALNFIDAVR